MNSIALLIGNSDNKLTQKEWAEFYTQIDLAVGHHSSSVYFTGATDGVAEDQSAAWVFSTKEAEELKLIVKLIREKYKQDKICWLECQPEFI